MMPERLSEIAIRNGTDKESKHRYSWIFERHFSAIRNKKLNVLEIGILRGASLKTWKEYFHNSKTMIYGVDIQDCSEYQEDRITVFQGSQADISLMTNLAEFIKSIDIVIDDGSHHVGEQQTTFKVLFPYLVHGGLYVIEDLATSYHKRYGGGWQKPGTTIEFIKKFVDVLHARYAERWNKNCNFHPNTPYIGQIKSLSVYDQIAFIEKS